MHLGQKCFLASSNQGLKQIVIRQLGFSHLVFILETKPTAVLAWVEVAFIQSFPQLFYKGQFYSPVFQS